LEQRSGSTKKGCKSTFCTLQFLFETIRVAGILWKNPFITVENLGNKALYPHGHKVINSARARFFEKA
jgi:hypothetical protein